MVYDDHMHSDRGFGGIAQPAARGCVIYNLIIYYLTFQWDPCFYFLMVTVIVSVSLYYWSVAAHLILTGTINTPGEMACQRPDKLEDG